MVSGTGGQLTRKMSGPMYPWPSLLYIGLEICAKTQPHSNEIDRTRGHLSIGALLTSLTADFFTTIVCRVPPDDARLFATMNLRFPS